jgi:SAM-dependent methyltransferase
MSLKYQHEHALDSPERTLAHKQIIAGKRFLRKLYLEWYALFQKNMANLPPGKVVELGSGGGFLKTIIPEVICSDILELPSNDLTFSALSMPFENESLSGIFMIDTFHHIPDPEKFLTEAARVVKKGGKIIMIEPANTFWGRFIYRNFHHEPFDPSGKWEIPDTGPLSGANGALPWIVFERDRERFQYMFPDFQPETIQYHTPLRYLLSGGVSYKAFVPAFSFGFFTRVDKLVASLFPGMSMFMTIILRKR